MTRRAGPLISPAIVRVTWGTARMARSSTSMPLCSRMRPRASRRVGPGRGPREIGWPPGRCGGRSATETRRAPRSCARRAWSALCTSTESTRERSRPMSRASPGCGSSGSTLWQMTIDCGRAAGGADGSDAPWASARAPAARSMARWAGTAGGIACTTTMASSPRRRRPTRTQVSGRAQLSARIVRGKGGTSGTSTPPRGTVTSTRCSREGCRWAHETRTTSCPASWRWWASIVVCAATPPVCGWVGPTTAILSAAAPAPSGAG